jgi:hypothetical protein
VERVTGTVYVQPPGAARPIRLTGATTVPDGSDVDARAGAVTITVVGPQGDVQRAKAKGGRFVVHLHATGVTVFELSERLTGCAGSARSTTAGPADKRKPKSKRKRTSRHLWVHDNGGSWGTKGKFASTTVEGTTWVTTDSCHATTVRVIQGRVRVRPLSGAPSRRITAPGHVTITGR